MTTLDTFRQSIAAEAPPAGADAALQALWWLLRGDWAKAHECVQAHEGVADCDSIHAHLHRQEGDLPNAGYWYRRAGRKVATVSLDDEWRSLAAEMLGRRPG